VAAVAGLRLGAPDGNNHKICQEVAVIPFFGSAAALYL